ncbi:MAG: GGDEF domain-containing phosphodiesterase [Lachnospiraceae bacterium]|nr:GGDEF domain-containing phosphodiesterase [Lachnospiraceae bacterium]
MYQFPEDLRRAYECSAASFVYYQNIDDKAVPVLASDGFCRAVGVPRERVLDWLSVAMFERMHTDDVGVVSKASDDFLHKRGPYDIVFRCHIDPSDGNPGAAGGAVTDMMIHGLGKWQIMPDGTELAVITYANLAETRELTKGKMKEYAFSRNDRFYKDSLTTLPNLNYLHEYGPERINAIRAGGRTPYLVYSDIIAMRSYNNQYGFKEGDRLLILIAKTLKQNLQKSLVTRAMDDHFIIIADSPSDDALTETLREINTYIRQHAYGNTTGLRFGVCPITEDVEPTEAIDHAKHALKQIENDLNREVSFYSQDAADAYLQSRYIIENFDNAIEHCWIKVYYHPLVRVENRKIAAFEGLARWRDPWRGTISPAAFIPVLSKYHLLYKLDLYMFEQICKEVKIRLDNGLDMIPVSVNFSRQDFDHADIVSEMNRIYDKYEIAKYGDKSNFIVEITEQDLAVEEDRFREQLRRLRESGYLIWLDDFCSGYSAINMFNRFEFDLVKFDMELLKHLDDHNGVNRVILRALVKMVRDLKIHPLIEGVETEEQLEFVKEIGCELAQGYYFSQPQPLDVIIDRKNRGDIKRECETPEEREALDNKLFQAPSGE